MSTIYVLAPDGVVQQYPYTVQQLRRDNRRIAFPRTISDELLARFNVYPVTRTDPPADFDRATQNLVQGTPIQNEDGDWEMGWDLIAISEEEAAERAADEALLVRAERNQKLLESDWTVLSDNPIPEEEQDQWVDYRENLRDLPEASGFPWTHTWPEKPNYPG